MLDKALGKGIAEYRKVVDGLRSRIEIQGKRVTFAETHYHQYPADRMKRGAIVTFSAAARRRMIRRCAEIDWEAAGSILFITLTYPPSHENCTYRERSKHRAIFQRFVEHHLGRKVGCLWRIEWKQRLSGPTKGCIAPHVHNLFFGMRFLSKRLIAVQWAKALGCKTPPIVDVQRLDAYKKVMIYLAKYCSKPADSLLLDSVPYHNKTGRHAGLLRKREIPFHPLRIVSEISSDLEDFIRRRASDALPWYDLDKDRGFSVFGEDATDLAKDIWEFFVDSEKVDR